MVTVKILIACEESQTLCKEFRKLGHEAYSCDILPCSGGHPEWHIQGDIIPLLQKKWDMIIAFPPCTYLTNAGMCNMTRKNSTDKYRQNRINKRDKARDFVLNIYNSNCPKIAIENGVGFLNSNWRKPDQIIRPFQFGHSVNKKTCLWLKGLPKLVPTNIVKADEITIWEGTGKKISKWYKETLKEAKGDLKLLSKIRSKTFLGIAEAMAKQWTNYFEQNKPEVIQCTLSKFNNKEDGIPPTIEIVGILPKRL